MSEGATGIGAGSSSDAGMRLLDQAIESYLASRADTPQLVKQAMAANPEQLMPRCFMGYLTRLAGDPRNTRRSAALHRDLAAAVTDGAGTAWERQHVTALGLWLADDLHTLMAHLEAIIATEPHDTLSLRMLHYLYFYDGDAIRMRDSVAASLPHYAGHAHEGYVKGMLAFGLEEAGDCEAAEHIGREAVEINPADAWAAHAVAHVMQMQGRSAEGIEWLRALRPQWHATNNFRWHLLWHEALYHLARHDHDAVLEIYDQDVGPAVEDDFYLDVCNAASLLLRLEAEGVEVGERWQPLVRIAEQHTEDNELVFASLHYLMPLLRTRHPAADRLVASLQAWARGEGTQAQVVREVALDVAAYMAALQAGDTESARTSFADFRDRLHRIGGSHAQRELFQIMQTGRGNGL